MNSASHRMVPHRGRPARTTISDVASALGIAKGTVSRALNGYPDIAETTRAKVKRKAEQLGYRPLSHAQAIKTGYSKSIGLVFQIDEHDSHRPFLAGFLGGVTRSASAEGWTVTIASATSSQDMIDTIARLVDERKSDGFILPRTLIHDARVEYLRSVNVPFVMFGRTGDDKDCSWYDILGESAMQSAVERLFKFGHRRIAFVNGGEGYAYSKFRLEGYLAGLAKLSLPFESNYIETNAVTVDQGKAAAMRLLALPEPPTAFVYAVDMAALGLYSAAEDLGLGIGSELSVISYDGIPAGAFARPPLTTFSVDRARAGERLASILITRIRGADPETLREYEHAQLVVRKSDGPLSLSSAELAARISTSIRKKR